jgi:hypothetical protein
MGHPFDDPRAWPDTQGWLGVAESDALVVAGFG